MEVSTMYHVVSFIGRLCLRKNSIPRSDIGKEYPITKTLVATNRALLASCHSLLTVSLLKYVSLSVTGGIMRGVLSPLYEAVDLSVSGRFVPHGSAYSVKMVSP